MKLTQEQVIEEIKEGKLLKDFPEWCDNKEVVLEAVKEEGKSLEYASKRLKDDKEIALKAVKQDGYNLEFASERLRDDKEVVLEAVKVYGSVFQYASERLKNDKEVMLEAIKDNNWALKYASNQLKKELLPQVLKSLGYTGSLNPIEIVKYDGLFLSLLTTEEQNNKEVVLEAVRKVGWVLRYASEKLRDDREVVLEAVKINRLAFEYASQGIKDKTGGNNPVLFLEQWIKGEKVKELGSQLDKKEKSSKIKI